MLLLSLIAREFRQSARKKRVQWLRLLFGGVIAFWSCAVATRSQLAGIEAVGRAAYDALMPPLVYGLILLAAVLAAPSVATECKEGTLGLLFHTRLRPHQIVLSKFVARLVELFSFVLVCLPLLALPILFGGVGHDEVVRDALVLLGLMIFCSAAGVCVSAFCRSETMAFVATLAVMATLDVALQWPRIVDFAQGAASTKYVGIVPARTVFRYQPCFGLVSACESLLGHNPKEVTAGVADLGLGVVFAAMILLVMWYQVKRLANPSHRMGLMRWRTIFGKANSIGNWLAALVCLSFVSFAVLYSYSRTKPRETLTRSSENAFAPVVFSSQARNELLPRRMENWYPMTVLLNNIGGPIGPRLFGQFDRYLEWASSLCLLLLVARSVAKEKDERTLESLVCTPISRFAILNSRVLYSCGLCWGWYLLFHSSRLMWVAGFLSGWESRVGHSIGNILMFLFATFVDFWLILAFGSLCSSFSKTVAQALTFAVLCFGAITILPSLLFPNVGAPWDMRYALRWWTKFGTPEWKSHLAAYLGISAVLYLFVLANFRRFARRS